MKFDWDKIKKILVIIAAVVFIIQSIIIIVMLFNPKIVTTTNTIREIVEKVEQAKQETDKEKEDTTKLIQELGKYKEENKKLREKLDKSDAKSLLDYGVFLDAYSNANDQMYISLSTYKSNLDKYKANVDTYKTKVEKELSKWSFSPYVLINPTNLNFGGGIDIIIPTRENFSFVGGIGYFNKDWYIKLGLQIRF